jgi:glutamyl-Q tRNA(Asp) synthetase
MAAATEVHVVLQRLLGLPTPTYRHHRLIRDNNGKRLAKRDKALSVRELRAQGLSVADIFAAVISSA